jgi:hypothetical protein
VPVLESTDRLCLRFSLRVRAFYEILRRPRWETFEFGWPALIKFAQRRAITTQTQSQLLEGQRS